MAVYTLVRLEMVKQGMSVRSLAKKLGLNEGQMSSVSLGKWACPKRLQEPIARELGMDLVTAWDELGRARLGGGEA